jgi:hypothetical protein
MDRFTVTILQLASTQKTVEHGNSDDLLVARHELAGLKLVRLSLVFGLN